MGQLRVAYVMKRYPRLSETFILNEIAMMEEYGAKLELFSLLQPEPPPHHPMVKEIRSSLHVLPCKIVPKLLRLVQAHGHCIRREPVRYARALGRAARLSVISGRPFNTWKQFLRAGFVADCCLQQNVTSIHAHFANTPAAVAWFASAMSAIPFSLTTHAKDLYLTPPRLLRRIIRDAGFVATCTRYNADYLRSVLDDRDHAKIHVVYHGVDLGRFAVRVPGPPQLSLTPPTMLSVGRLVEKKGFGDLIAACHMLRQDGLRFRCIIVGEGPLRATLQESIARKDLADCVVLQGAMTHADLIALYAKADVFVLAPRIVANGDRDGIPNVIVEAMASGVPVVSTSVSGIPEVVRNGTTGVLVPSESPKALAAALHRLLRDSAYRARLARNARIRIEQDFHCRETTKSLRDMMHRCGNCREPANISVIASNEIATQTVRS
jgi:glycosyltransferase involved in cell wall biosynthesis